jgi:hypothetical protein
MKMPRKGSTPLRFSGTNTESPIIRHMQALPVFDRTLLTIMTLRAYGTVSRIVSELFNEGYLEEVKDAGKPVKAEYNQAALRRNPDLKGVKLNYGKGKNIIKSAQYRKSSRWSELMTRWRAARISYKKKVELQNGRART